jgi:hypothetical protein
VIRLTRSPSVALLGEAPPRVRVAPPPTRANSWEDVADLSARAGVILDPWQEMILQDAMGERVDQTWSAKRVGISVPRQNGKSQLLVSRALAGALLFGELKIVISAHQQDTARESFGKLMEIVEADANGWIRERIKPGGIMQALNREAIRFTNGATIQFKARSGAGSRGFSSDCLMLDEAQILSQRAWVSINSTMSAMPNPQIWLLGTPPTPEDDGAVFGSIRAAAKAGKSNTTAWLEWAADPNADPALDETRWSANPAWTTRINHEVVQGEFETYPADRFALDRLGIWLEDLNRQVSIFPTWPQLVGEPETPTSFAIAADIDQTRFVLAGAHGEFVDLVTPAAFTSPQVAAAQRALFVAEVARIADRNPVGIQEKGPAWTLAPDLEAAGVVVQPVTMDGFVQACADFEAAVLAGTLRHLGQAELDTAVRSAAWRTVGDRRVISRKKADIPELEAAIIARHVEAEASNYDIADSFG